MRSRVVLVLLALALASCRTPPAPPASSVTSTTRPSPFPPVRTPEMEGTVPQVPPVVQP